MVSNTLLSMVDCSLDPRLQRHKERRLGIEPSWSVYSTFCYENTSISSLTNADIFAGLVMI